MTGLRHHLRLPWFALAAIVGMLSMAVEASARPTGGAADPPKACCVVPTPSACCCCPAKVEPLPTSAGPRASAVVDEVRPSAPGRPCECRSDEPAVPTSKPESSRDGRHPDRADDEAVATAFPVRPSISSARFVPPTGSPPKSPLHLLTTRLLI